MSMKNRIKTYAALISVCLLMTAVLPISVLGADKGAGLVLKYEYSGTKFYVYQVTDRQGNRTEAFKAYEGSIDCSTNGEQQKLAIALVSLVENEQIEDSASGIVENEELVLSGLEPGWYLVRGETLKQGKYTYAPVPFMVKLTEGLYKSADIKSDSTEEEPINPSEPDDPTEPTKPVNRGDNDSDSDEPEKPTAPSPENTNSGLTDDSGDPLVDVISDTDETPGEESPGLAVLAKLGDMGASRYLVGMIVSLGLLGIVLILYYRIERNGKHR